MSIRYTVVEGGTVITMDARRRVGRGDVLIDGNTIAAVRLEGDPPFDIGASTFLTVDARGCAVLPGLVQAHVHVCQTLCRGSADDLPLLEWLKERVWPYEASLDEKSMRACARLAAAELLLGGTTAILDMGTVHETDALFDALGRTGLRVVGGKAMMDHGDGVPARLRETTRASLDESDRLRRDWEGKFDGRIGYAYAPRFVLSCTEELLREVAARVAAGARVHTHASEQLPEVELVRRERGDENIRYFDRLGLGGPQVTLAHCVHPTVEERAILAARGTHVTHCPSSNLKLGSGIAPIPEMLAEGISIALGADGAPCNNNLDGMLELRLAALLHKHRVGPAKMTAMQALELATLGGARALGLGDRIGALEVGKRADLIVVDLETPHVAPSPDPVSAVVYGARASDVRHVFVDGRHLVAGGLLTEATGLERAAVVAEARAARVAAGAAV
jgi:cytosine/adenosine deaminase-related metal-dependent hydrolase